LIKTTKSANAANNGACPCEGGGHPVYQKPELLAERPNEVWSWDITKLMGPAKWNYFYLYVILDIFSRRVVGWCVADAESAALFQPLFDNAIEKHSVRNQP
jgi:putative transposase